MPEFLLQLAQYWWVAFPLAAAAGGVAQRIARERRRNNRQRHEYELEKMRLQAQLQAGIVGAPQPLGATASDSASNPAAQPTSTSDTLTRLMTEHDDITARWLDYELDVAKLIAFPTMSDGRRPLTAAFLRAKRSADALRPASATATITTEALNAYLDAVGTYAVAFETAEKEARRLRTSTFSDDERARLDRAQQLLRVALDDAATQAERHTAYKRVRAELDGLIVLSDEAVQVLEKKVAGELEAPTEPGEQQAQ